jgi:hypothetical protein
MYTSITLLRLYRYVQHMQNILTYNIRSIYVQKRRTQHLMEHFGLHTLPQLVDLDELKE